MLVQSFVPRGGLCTFALVLLLTSAAFAQVEVSKLRPDLVWQRTSPAKGSTEGPVLYQLVLSGGGTPGTIAKFDTNPRHLVNSLITDNGTMVAIGAFSVDSTGLITFKSGQTFSGDGSGLNSLNAANLASGTVSAARLPLATSSDTTAGLLVQANDTRLTNSRAPSAGSSFYIQNTNSAQTANMSITGTAVVGSTVTAGNLVSSQLSSSTGQALTVNAGDGSGSGGALTVRAGDAGSGSGGGGGDLTLKAGSAVPLGGVGYTNQGPAGKVNITAGGGYNGVGGNVTITSGPNSNWSLSAPGTHSYVTLQGGTLLGSDGAYLFVEGAGNGCSNNSCGSYGGNVSVTAGNGSGGLPGGKITLTPGTGTPNGDVHVVGNLSVTGTVSKGGGSFKIDDPLDPANKYLSHSFVESPDMMNVYNGNVVLDAKGEAWVVLPDYFEALNQDFRYQLTAIGAPGPDLYVAQEIKGNRFQIAGGHPNGKVSWQVTGIRHDAYANAHRIPTEEEKVGDDRGSYLHPELFGQSEAKRIIIPREMPRGKSLASAQK